MPVCQRLKSIMIWATNDKWMARRMTEYLFLRMKDSAINCHIYAGIFGVFMDDDEEIDKLEARWAAIDNDGEEFLKFDRVEVKLSTRPDIHAFILLNSLFPKNRDIVSGAEHDEIYLDVNDEQAGTLNDAQILELSRCGVRYDTQYCCLCMFV